MKFREKMNERQPYLSQLNRPMAIDSGVSSRIPMTLI